MRESAASLLACLLVLFGCTGSSENRAEIDREEIQAALESYLPLLGETYATGNLELLEGWAAEKEISRIHKRIEDLAVQGRTLVPTFRRVTVEEANVWNYSNAYVTTLEVWDLAVYATGTDQVLSQELEQPNRVKYQLKRENDRWRVLFRTIQE
jgi:hypothetical protein